ncbi:MAG TPA: MarR family transcriptional regulator [Solirubrobacterales bacterium]|nr:MarR family transcriptional regulator [Solirubrobacterales bacterium]
MDRSEELRYLILAAQREGNRALSVALRPYGLTTAQAEAVDVLRKARRPLTVKEIGERLIYEHGSPSRLMRTLVEKGLVERLAAKDDRRLTMLRLNARGRAAAGRMTEAKRQIDEAIAPILEQHDVDATLALLRSLIGDLPAGRALARRIADEEATS